MEHGQQTAESIGAILSSIASTLREVSEKLDTVAARIDGTPAVTDEHTIEARLAKLEAWAFHAAQDISGIDARVEQLETGAAPSSDDRQAATDHSAAALPPVAAGRSHTRRSERDTTQSAHASQNGAARESTGSRNGTRPQDSHREPVHAAHEPNSTAQRGFTPPHAPAMPRREPKTSSEQNFTAPATREPASFTTTTPAAPAVSFTVAPTPREQGLGLRETLPAASEPAASSTSFSPRENETYDNETYDSVASVEPGSNHPRDQNGSTPPGTGLTGAHRAAEEDRTPAENPHVDKLQAMLDELKRTAATSLGRSDVFAAPAGDAAPKGHQSERADARRSPTDYRLSSPPPA
ncbi:hypothetical protein [Nocardia sp. R6R-6]|uniref:hypothetical protein n=1 Tax=Nocardia sp. R6R-6 TaxID=3459303 RepID=UPI00403D6CA9